MELNALWFNCYSMIPLLLTFVDAYAPQVYSWVAVDSLSDSNNSSRLHRPGKPEGHVLHKGPSWDGRRGFARAPIQCFGISAVERHETLRTIYFSAIRLCQCSRNSAGNFQHSRIRQGRPNWCSLLGNQFSVSRSAG